MELQLEREYLTEGTNGLLWADDRILCYTIELPWRNNIRMRSCIPEGRYQLVRRYSERHKTHLLVRDVPSRTLILIHPATYAEKELRGCIAPVSKLNGPGRGQGSIKAFAQLMGLVSKVLKSGETVWLTIGHKPPEDHS
ncbi:DUF5675 family protein [Flavihumibacter solisilvae]|uniref:DUF5675 domain-containing protein n=1 Tax=Flavihumibacter solisilvae TaxID=1349421 RepID=A0A0C1L3N8_9BACT|nr:DUF5675 family protein [Flavihumibacter solisilvae]KIC94647.1 hypothetical protein OI18_11210 [Flavihumibacter solisilvae]